MLSSCLLRLTQLRKKLFDSKVEGVIISYGDRFKSGSPSERYQQLKWLTGFRGSAGFAVVLSEKAALFVDGRYTLQAMEQVDLGLFSVQPYSMDALQKWLKVNFQDGKTLLFDEWAQTVQQILNLENCLKTSGISLQSMDESFLDEVWQDRPHDIKNNFKIFPEIFCGESFESKLSKVINFINQKDAEVLMLTSAESASWFLNLRGEDTKYTPLCHLFCLIDRNKNVSVFVDLEKVTADIRSRYKNIKWFSFNVLNTVISSLERKTILVDFSYLPFALYQLLKRANTEIISEVDPCLMGRAIKNVVEQEWSIKAHKSDGIAIINFLSWLDNNLKKRNITESEATEYLLSQRKRQENFLGDSFCTISAAGPHGAMIHYHPSASTDVAINNHNLYLFDSGGQYGGATTDVTRTIAVNDPTDEQKENFTRVLKGHIALSTAVFPSNTTGHQLDVLARQFLWQVGLDFDHSTGHGVGSYLNVHEGPHGISKKFNTVPLQKNMLVTNEPGYYKNNEYGIRIENVMMVEACEGELSHMLRFRTVTLVPIDKKLVKISALSSLEIEWINNYHGFVYQELSHLIDKENQEWLRVATDPIKII